MSETTSAGRWAYLVAAIVALALAAFVVLPLGSGTLASAMLDRPDPGYCATALKEVASEVCADLRGSAEERTQCIEAATALPTPATCSQRLAELARCAGR